MMRLISNGEPYVYTHQCTGGERKGETMSMEGIQRFLVETLYESFRHCRKDRNLSGVVHITKATTRSYIQNGWRLS